MFNDLIPNYPIAGEVLLEGITDDSRRIGRGDLFCALAGENYDARQFVHEAIDKGAAAVLCEPPLPEEITSDEITRVLSVIISMIPAMPVD